MTLLEEFDPNAVKNDQVLMAEMALMKLYVSVKTQEMSIWLSFASEKVLPLVQDKVKYSYLDSTPTTIRENFESVYMGSFNPGFPLPKGH